MEENTTEEKKINTLIVDDSGIVRAMLGQVLGDDKRFNVLDTAENGQIAVEKNELYQPDLITMDIKMPVMDGITATRKIFKTSRPAIIAFTTEDDSKTSCEMFDAGAIELKKKPNLATMSCSTLESFCDELAEIVYSYEKYRNVKSNREYKLEKKEHIAELEKQKKEFMAPQKVDVVMIGASTGGPVAIQTVLKNLGPDFNKPVLITQHIDNMFNEYFASWLTTTTGMNCTIAQDGEILEKSHAYIAPDNRHLLIKEAAAPGKYQIVLDDSEPFHYFKPAVDKMFIECSKVLKEKAMAIILTGMGKDGAEGCAEIVKNGGWTIAQSEESCIVFGMPKAAIEKKAVKAIKPLEEIAEAIKSKIL